ncbi:MAG: hypothetical protein RLZZ519_2414 [Bacteroidota bacterium]|jgi:hypothetical protein
MNAPEGYICLPSKISAYTAVMNTIVRFLLIALCLGQAVFAQTMVSGGIYNDVTWSLAGSPYIVTGNVVVFPGKTLTIEPGVEVRVQGNLFTVVGGVLIEVRGKLVAVGTPTAPIVFKADGINPDPHTWNGILIKSSQGGDCEINYVHMSNMFDGLRADSYATGIDTVRYNNCIFTHNGTAFTVFRQAIFNDCRFAHNDVAVTGSSLPSLAVVNCDFDSNAVGMGFIYHNVTIDSCTFRGNLKALIANHPGSVTNCLFEANETAVQGIGYALSNCTLLNNQTAVGPLDGGSVTDCIIRNNTLGVDLTTGGVLVGNEIGANVIGVKVWDNNVTFTDNRICGNSQFNVENAADKNISLVGNCFCESDSTIAEQLLFDGYDDITRGLFNYALYDASCTNVVQLVSKVNIVTGVMTGFASTLEVFPNPARDFLEVRHLEANAGATIRLMNLQGQVMRVMTDAAQLRIDVSSLPAGIYLLEYQGVDRQVIKWIKE